MRVRRGRRARAPHPALDAATARSRPWTCATTSRRRTCSPARPRWSGPRRSASPRRWCRRGASENSGPHPGRAARRRVPRRLSRWATSPRRRSPRCARPAASSATATTPTSTRSGTSTAPARCRGGCSCARSTRLAALIAEHLPSDARAAVTGDHGMVTVDRTVDADTDPDAAPRRRLVGGDARARHVYARPGRGRRRARDVAGGARRRRPGCCRASRRSRRAGSARSSPRVVDRIGDVVVAACGGTALIRTRMEPGLAALVGQHGGLTADEQMIPLLLAHNA